MPAFRKIFYLSLIICLLTTAEVFPQQFLLKNHPQSTASFDLRYMHPEFSYDRFESFATGVYELNFRVPVSSKLNLDILMPFSTIAVSSNSFNSSQNTIGNIYVGLQHRNSVGEYYAERIFTLSFGVYLPTTDEKRFDAGILGTLADYPNAAKYYPHTLSLTFGISNQWNFNHGLDLRLDLGPDVLMSTDGAGRESTVLVRYGISPGYSADHLFITAELAGALILNRGTENFAERFINSLSVGGGWKSRHLSAGLFYEWNTNTWLKNIVTGALGAKLGIVLP